MVAGYLDDSSEVLNGPTCCNAEIEGERPEQSSLKKAIDRDERGQPPWESLFCSSLIRISGLI